MKKLIVLGLLLLAIRLAAAQIVVFAKDNSAALDLASASPQPKDSAQASFLAAYQADLAHPAAFAAPIPLVAPPAWGRAVPGATGKIRFHDAFRGGFVVQLDLTGLTPSHQYILCLNGNPALAGNDLLPDGVPGNEKEKYLDFQTVTTDAQGAYHATFGIALQTGAYDVRLYVKDTDDFKIVLYHDYFKFKVD
jgi:hypothetical protein